MHDRWSDDEWRKSSYSGGDGGECVEVAERDDEIGVRDSKDPGGPVLVFEPEAFRAFINGLDGLRN